MNFFFGLVFFNRLVCTSTIPLVYLELSRNSLEAPTHPALIFPPNLNKTGAWSAHFPYPTEVSLQSIAPLAQQVCPFAWSAPVPSQVSGIWEVGISFVQIWQKNNSWTGGGIQRVSRQLQCVSTTFYVSFVYVFTTSSPLNSV